MLQVIDLLLTLPAHSADCERGLSHSKLVKNDWRSKLSDTDVTDCLTVELHTPAESDFCPEDAVRHGNAATVRRPNQLCSSSSSRKDDSEEDTNTEDCDSYLTDALARLAQSADVRTFADF